MRVHPSAAPPVGLPPLGRPLRPSTPVTPAAPQPATPQPTPEAFRLLPGRIELPSQATILTELSRGRPFAPPVAQRFAAILGRPISAAGFERLFLPILPSATWVASDAIVEGDQAASFILSAIDRQGRIVFSVGVAMVRCKDGAIEVHNFGASVSPLYRGVGVTAHGELLQEAILRALSRHPNTRLTLSANTALDANTGHPQPGNGCLVHAARGYLFADSFDMRSYFTDYAQSPLYAPGDTDRVLMTKHFAAWLRHEPTLQVGGVAADASVRESLVERMQRCSQPHEFLLFQKAGCSALAPRPDGGMAPMDLGKAFMLSGQTPEWCGVRFVNPPAPETPAALVRLRDTSRAVFLTQMGREDKDARRRAEGFTKHMWEEVEHADPIHRAAGYRAVGLHGHPSLSAMLQERLHGRRSRMLPGFHHRAVEQAPEIRQALQEALEMMRGTYMRGQMRAATVDPHRTPEARLAMQKRLAILEGRIEAG